MSCIYDMSYYTTPWFEGVLRQINVSKVIWTNNHLVGKRTLNHLGSLAKWVFVYELSGCGFESPCCHLNFRYGAGFEQGVPWHSRKL